LIVINDSRVRSNRLDWPLVDYFVDQAVGLGFLRRHEEITIRIRLDAFEGLARTVGQLPVELVFEIKNLIGLDANITAWPLAPPKGW